MAARWSTKAARSPSTAPRRSTAVNYAKALYETFIPGTESWLDINNNRAFLAGQVSLTANGVSLYYAAKKDAGAVRSLRPIIRTTNFPVGPVGQSVELHQTSSLPAVQAHASIPKPPRPISSS